MNGERFPHLVAMLEGRLSMYDIAQWPMMKMELALYEREVEAVREFAARLLVIHERRDEATARAIVERIAP